MDDRELLVRVDENVKGIRTWVDKHDCQHKDLRQDIDILKQFRWQWAGGWSVVMFLISFFGTGLGQRVFGGANKEVVHAEAVDSRSVSNGVSRVRGPEASQERLRPR